MAYNLPVLGEQGGKSPEGAQDLAMVSSHRLFSSPQIGWTLVYRKAPKIPLFVPASTWTPEKPGIPAPRGVCRRVLEGDGEGPGWPLLGPRGAYGIATDKDLCQALVDLERSFRVFTYELPRRLSHPDLLCSSVNRGYNVEGLVVRHLRDGPFATKSPEAAQFFLNPVTTCRWGWAGLGFYRGRHFGPWGDPRAV